MQVGLEEEGLTDVVSGLLSGGFALGGGVGPLLGGLLADWFGFEWSAAAFGAMLAATGLAVCAVGACTRCRSRAAEAVCNGDGGLEDAQPVHVQVQRSATFSAVKWPQTNSLCPEPGY